VQCYQRGKVLSVGEPASPSGAAEPVRDRSWDPAQHDVFMLAARAALALGRPEDEVLAWLKGTRIRELHVELLSIPTRAGSAFWNSKSPLFHQRYLDSERSRRCQGHLW
jgi:hypothetical protein